MHPDPAAIEDYIRSNRGTYTDKAIRDSLVSVGHDPAAVAAAFRRLGADPPPDEPRPPSTALITAGLVMFIVGGLIGMAGFIFAGPYASGGSWLTFLIGYLLLGGALLAVLRWFVLRLGINGGLALLIGLLLVPIYGALTLGTCSAAFSIPSG